MDSTDVLELSRESIVVLLKVGAPIMLIALLVGVGISLLQALTQMQEATISFVPKIIVLFVALVFLMPFMLVTLTTFAEHLMDRIVAHG